MAEISQIPHTTDNKVLWNIDISVKMQGEISMIKSKNHKIEHSSLNMANA